MNFDLMSLIKMLSNNNIKDFNPQSGADSAASQQSAVSNQNNAAPQKYAKNGQNEQANGQSRQDAPKKQPEYTANYNYAAFVARHDRLSKEIDRRLLGDEPPKS